MSPLMIVLTSGSLVGLLAIAVSRFIRLKNGRSFTSQLFVICACFVFLYLFYYTSEAPIHKGSGTDSLYFTIVLYIFMLLGMLAQYCYTNFALPKEDRDFDLGLFVAPVFASPVVFIPLLAALLNSDINLKDLTTTRIMVFFVAFENGFFWKEYFDNRRRRDRDDS